MGMYLDGNGEGTVHPQIETCAGRARESVCGDTRMAIRARGPGRIHVNGEEFDVEDIAVDEEVSIASRSLSPSTYHAVYDLPPTRWIQNVPSAVDTLPQAPVITTTNNTGISDSSWAEIVRLDADMRREQRELEGAAQGTIPAPMSHPNGTVRVIQGVRNTETGERYYFLEVWNNGMGRRIPIEDLRCDGITERADVIEVPSNDGYPRMLPGPRSMELILRAVGDVGVVRITDPNVLVRRENKKAQVSKLPKPKPAKEPQRKITLPKE